MATTAVLGCLFGDEAKAKIVDVMAAEHDVIVRFQGGSNAGHTIINEGQKYILHLVPSGILHPGKICLLGNGTVVDIFSLIEEIDLLQQKGIDFTGRFFVDEHAHLVLPIHKELDCQHEAAQKETQIGTTKKGIGPCYSDKYARVGIRICDLHEPDYLRKRLSNLYAYHRVDITPETLYELTEQLCNAGKKIDEFRINGAYLLHSLQQEDKNILLEGAQGSLLDVDYGTYPYVTSSHTVSGGIAIGCGLPPKNLQRIVGVYKSYFTRVGEGPFVTEIFGETADFIRESGQEYGATTGRPRRIGWFDLVTAKYTAMLNGVSEIALTLLDVFKGLDVIKVATNYTMDGRLTAKYPSTLNELAKMKPVYQDLPGFKEDISCVKIYRDLPVNARNYVEFIEEKMGVKVSIVSVGPDRGQTIFR